MWAVNQHYGLLGALQLYLQYFQLLNFYLQVFKQRPADVNQTIAPESNVYWGTWGKWEYCGPNTYAVAFQLKTESEKGGSEDDTSLNSIALYCGEHPGINDFGERFTSSEGPYGDWGEIMFCHSGFFTGANFRSEPKQASGDDTAGNNLALRCSNGHEIFTEAPGSKWGSWLGWKNCPDGTKICGLRTLVAPLDVYWNDDTSLNAVEFACC